jgi:ankyrin repeat protein
LAELLRARGEHTEAIPLYERILREFSDQEAIVEVAQTRLGNEARLANADGESSVIGRLQKMLKESPDLLNAVVDGMTPLESAAGDGEVEVVKYLLKNKANVEGSGKVYEEIKPGKLVISPLGRAIAGSRSQVVNILIDAGAKVVDGMLHTAVATGNLAIVEMLLAAEADPNLVFESDAILQLKFANKSGVTAPTPPSLPASQSAARWHLSPLEIAAYKNFAAVARLLVFGGAKIRAESSALRFAAESKNAALVKLVIEAGANPNASWKRHRSFAAGDGWTSLHIAGFNGEGEVVKILLDAGADVTSTDKDGATPLHVAKGDAVEFLLTAGADANAAGKHGMTPLFNLWPTEAAAGKARALIAAGADVNLALKSGATPLLFLAERKSGSEEAIKLLIEAGADISHSSGYSTPLNIAAGYDHVKTVSIFLEAGADPNHQDVNGLTALHFATTGLAIHAIPILLKAGVDPNVPAAAGLPPLARLGFEDTKNRSTKERKLRNLENFAKVVRILVDAGADPNAMAPDGDSLLSKAAQREDKATVNYLLEKGASAAIGAKAAFLHTDDGELKAMLFVHAQLEAPDRRKTIRLLQPLHTNVLGTIGAFVDDEADTPPCPHDLLELYGYFATRRTLVHSFSLWRLSEQEPIQIGLAELLMNDQGNGIELQWGDVIEFHPADDEIKAAVSEEARAFLERQLRRSVELVWQNEKGEELQRRKIDFYPGRWKRIGGGSSWLPVSQNFSQPLPEGVRELSMLPTLRQIYWEDDNERKVRAVKVQVMRNGRSFEVESMHSTREPDVLPEDGDVIVFIGETEAPSVRRTGSSKTSPRRPPTPRSSRTRTIVPPPSR